MGASETRHNVKSCLLKSLLLLIFVSKAECQYPPQVDVENLLLDLTDHWQVRPSENTPAASQDKGVTLPYINTYDYLSRLAQWASLSVIKSAIIIVGPRSSGKSEGLNQIKPYWEKLGHVILDIDLKGKITDVTSQDVMWDVAKEVTRTFYSIKYQAQKCMYDELMYECAANNTLSSWRSTLYNSWSILYTINYKAIIGTIVGISGVSVGTLYYAMASVFAFVKRHLRIILPLLLILFFLVAFLLYVIKWYIIAEIVVHPVRKNIVSGDWYTLICSCNAISKCAPERRPIVIVRELTNFDPRSLEDFLRSLERMKQGDIHYPVLVESSDFQWAYEFPVLRSSDSYMMYHLQAMTKKEVRSEVVHKFKIWTEEEFELIYDAIGGHRGSYRLMYDYNKVQKYSLSVSIGHLKRRAYDQVLEAVANGNRRDIETWMLSFKENGYNITVADIYKDNIRVFFKRNILFRDSKYVYPQNKLMEHAIDDYISDFCHSDQIKPFN